MHRTNQRPSTVPARQTSRGPSSESCHRAAVRRGDGCLGARVEPSHPANPSPFTAIREARTQTSSCLVSLCPPNGAANPRGAATLKPFRRPSSLAVPRRVEPLVSVPFAELDTVLLVTGREAQNCLAGAPGRTVQSPRESHPKLGSDFRRALKLNVPSIRLSLKSYVDCVSSHSATNCSSET